MVLGHPIPRRGGSMRRDAVIGAVLAGWLSFGATSAIGQGLTPVPKANPKVTGVSVPNAIAVELAEVIRAQGSMSLENPMEWAVFYGYSNDQPQRPLLPALGTNLEATKTEPDKNTSLVLRGQKGADPNYDYGTHFLFQGHEVGATINGVTQSYITRINLDADVAHRVTLLATTDSDGDPIAGIDGSTWDPWAKRLLFTT